MRQKLQTLLFALVAIMMPIGASALTKPYTIGASGVTTFYMPFAIGLPTGLQAFYVTGVTVNDDGTVKLVEQEITGVIPAHTAVILRGEPGEHALEIIIDEVDPVVSEEDNLLKGTLIDKPLDCSKDTRYFALCAGSTGDNVWADWQAPTNEDGTSYTLGANSAYLELPEDLDPSKLKELPHLQHTHGGCEICGQNTGVIVINMSDSYGDGWNGASITVKKDGEELDETETIEDGTEATVTLVYDLNSRYTFYWDMGECDYECSFEIIVNGENVFEALLHESESGTVSDCEDFTTEEPFFTLEATAIAEAKWGTSADAETFTYGTLAEAFAATFNYGDGNETCISTEVRYIQLLSDVTSETGYVVYGGTFTLDLNGKTLQSNEYTLDIRSEVTITDESSDKSGKVITTGIDFIAVYIHKGSSKITIEGGQYKSNNQSAVSIESESCEVTINGGEFTTTESANKLITNLGTLTINGGTFDAQNAQYAIYVGGNTTISDGTFVGAQTADVTYCGGTLTFEATEATDETPGFSPMGLRVDYNAEASINLPDGYGIYNEYEEPQSELVTNEVYYIGKTGGAGYTVTFSANYDTEATMDDAIVTSPTGKYVLPECEFTAPDGMMFDGWQVGDDEENLYQPGDVITITADTEVTAVWGDIKIVINMSDSYGDGWHGAYIEVLKDGESIGRATLENGYDDGRATFDYDSNCTYSFIWHYGPGINYLHEISFEISIGEEQLFTSEEGDCEEYADGEQIYPLPTSDELSIADGSIEEFYCKKTIVGTLTYTRTLPNLVWNALYVPFEIPMSELENYDVAYINDVHSYDNNEDGEIDDLKMEVIKITTGTLKANYPYLIRAKNEEAKEMSIVLTDATLYATSSNKVSCSSVFMQFDVTGTYSQMSSEDLDGSLVITSDGSWKQLAENSVLRPFRLYLTMTAIDGSPVKVNEQAVRSMRIVARGESEGTTSIDNGQWIMDNEPTVIYDLMGRRVAQPTKGMYIVNGRKVVIK